jgi:hypothetical protein
MKISKIKKEEKFGEIEKRTTQKYKKKKGVLIC